MSRETDPRELERVVLCTLHHRFMTIQLAPVVLIFKIIIVLPKTLTGKKKKRPLLRTLQTKKHFKVSSWLCVLSPLLGQEWGKRISGQGVTAPHPLAND